MTTYGVWQGQSAGNPKFGTFWMYARLDFRVHNAAQNDVFNLLKLRNGWVVQNSYWKIVVGSASGADWEIGYSGATTDIVDLSTTTTATDGTQGSETPASPYRVTADKYLQVVVGDAAESAGVLDVAVEIFAGPEYGNAADMNIDD